MTGIGLIAHNHTLVNWGITTSSSHGWQFAFGAAMMIVAGLILTGGWRRILRVHATLFWMVTGSLIICGLVALFTSHGTFIHNFNNFARPYTHSSDTSNDVIASAKKAGVNTHPAFSFASTIPVIGILATTAIYSYWTTYVGGELRQGSSRRTANNMAIGGAGAVLVVMIFGAIFFRTFGHRFEIAANSGNMPSQIAIANTPFFFLISASLGSTIFAVIVFVGYIVFWPLIMYISLLQQTRTLFAYSFDGILPKGVTKVSGAGSPYVAVVISVIGSIIYRHYSALGISDKGKFITFVLVTLALSVVYSIGAKLVRRSQGVDVDLSYAEIPPE